jgi:hypothetical protein
MMKAPVVTGSSLNLSLIDICTPKKALAERANTHREESRIYFTAMTWGMQCHDVRFDSRGENKHFSRIFWR